MITTRQPYTFDRVVRIIISITILVGLLWLIKTLSSVLLPFFVACLIAYIFEPFVQFNRRIFKLKGRLFAIILTLIEAIVIIGGACYIFIPILIEEMSYMTGLLRQYATSEINTPFISEGIQDFIRKNIDLDRITVALTRQDWANIAKQAFSFLSGSVNLLWGLFGWFIVILYVIFIMLDYDRLFRGFKKLIPTQHKDTVLRIGNDIKDSMNHYFRGQSLVAFIVGILFCIGFSIVGLPLAIILGLFIGLLNMVPYLQLISIIPTTLLCMVCSVESGTNFWVIWWECMAVYGIVQVIQDFFLVPKIMGKTMGLNPAIILLSLSIWGSLLGFLGLIIALPLTSLLLAYYNRLIIRQEPLEKK